jgi:hypothetical protein
LSTRVRRTVLKLLVEYALITLPILLYVAMESIRQECPQKLITSPEWSIATIFLTIQAIRLYLEEMRDPARQLLSGILILFLAAVTIAASINTYIGLDEDHSQSTMTIVIKWGVFLLASVSFVYIAGAAIYSKEE